YVPATNATSASSSTNATLVPLSALATRTLSHAPVTIAHDNQFPAVTLSYNLREGVSMSDANAAIKAAVASLNLPNTILP
ncbi:efflux RND transporter permease subunit, partial [Burkholderia sp. SIMBA_048]|uniref:efflux RND transporter permease subunit n=1 Tax=Burkholderia sp. SIMBA_048 TaxID=3085789 RepID=UPI00397C001F